MRETKELVQVSAVEQPLASALLGPLVAAVAQELVKKLASSPRREEFFLTVVRATRLFLDEPSTGAAPPAAARTARPKVSSPKATAPAPMPKKAPCCTSCGRPGHRRNACPRTQAQARQTKPRPAAEGSGGADADPEPACAVPTPPDPVPLAASDRRSARPRARTFNHKSLHVLKQHSPRRDWEASLDLARPRTRRDCESGPRPCPFIGCRHHLAIVVDPECGSIKEVFPEFRILLNPGGDGLARMQAAVGTCALDIAATVDQSGDGVAGLLALHQAAGGGRKGLQAPGMTEQAIGRANNLGTERSRQLLAGALQALRVKLRRHVDGGLPLPRPQSQSFIELRRAENRAFVAGRAMKRERRPSRPPVRSPSLVVLSTGGVVAGETASGRVSLRAVESALMPDTASEEPSQLQVAAR
jgi:hypothetical protein